MLEITEMFSCTNAELSNVAFFRVRNGVLVSTSEPEKECLTYLSWQGPIKLVGVLSAKVPPLSSFCS
jgi:hypothetical protein